jgi:hypothetical protein
MALTLYNLDQKAHDLVLEFRDTGALKQVFKMRSTAVYGLERFWGEPLRLEGHEARYWRETWKVLKEIVVLAGIKLPDTNSDRITTAQVQAITKELWDPARIDQRQVSLAVLIQLCDAMVWWTQRYKTANDDLNDQGNDD